MSRLSLNLLELRRLAEGGAGALTTHLMREIAASLISFGCGSWRQA
jgi:hypothetical protein